MSKQLYRFYTIRKIKIKSETSRAFEVTSLLLLPEQLLGCDRSKHSFLVLWRWPSQGHSLGRTELTADLGKNTHGSFSECFPLPFFSQALNNGSINLAQHIGLSDLVATCRNHFAYKNLFWCLHGLHCLLVKM